MICVARKTREVHPVADLFPMLPDDELRELAEDIKANGLLESIKLDAEGRVLDGRNRLAACELAGVEPRFEDYAGEDPAQYALSVNLARRHLNKGQRAMIAAKWWSVSDHSKRSAASVTGISATRLMNARTVLDHAPDLAQPVIAGSMALDDAYEEARRLKTLAQSDERLLGKLRDRAPDLADAVAEERLKLREALAAAEERERELREEIAISTRNLKQGIELLDPRVANPEVYVEERAAYWDLSVIDAGAVIRTAEMLTALAAKWETDNGH